MDQQEMSMPGQPRMKDLGLAAPNPGWFGPSPLDASPEQLSLYNPDVTDANAVAPTEVSVDVVVADLGADIENIWLSVLPQRDHVIVQPYGTLGGHAGTFRTDFTVEKIEASEAQFAPDPPALEGTPKNIGAYELLGHFESSNAFGGWVSYALHADGQHILAQLWDDEAEDYSGTWRVSVTSTLIEQPVLEQLGDTVPAPEGFGEFRVVRTPAGDYTYQQLIDGRVGFLGELSKTPEAARRNAEEFIERYQDEGLTPVPCWAL